MAGISTSRLSLRRVVAGGFGALRANLLMAVALALFLSAGPSGGLIMLQRAVEADSRAKPPTITLPLPPASNERQSAAKLTPIRMVFDATQVVRLGLFWLAWLAIVLPMEVLLRGMITATTISHLSGRRPSVRASAGDGLRQLWPLFLIYLCSTGGLLLWSLLLVIPAFIMGATWAVAIPSRMVEHTGVFRSFARSAELTKGNRWAIFGLFVAYCVAFYAVLLTTVAVTGGFRNGFVAGLTGPTTSLYITPVVSGLGRVVAAAVLVGLYCELRRVREGIAPGGIEALFD